MVQEKEFGTLQFLRRNSMNGIMPLTRLHFFFLSESQHDELLRKTHEAIHPFQCDQCDCQIQFPIRAERCSWFHQNLTAVHQQVRVSQGMK